MIQAKQINISIIIKEYLPIVLMIIITANTAGFIRSSFFFYGLLIYTGAIFFFKKKRFNRMFLIITTIWLLINILSWQFNQTADSLLGASYFNMSFYKLFTAYFLFILSGVLFFTRLEKTIYILTLISFPFFAAELLIPSVMNSIPAPIACNYSDLGGWYILIYFHTIVGQGEVLYRNCGFMWEPGAFAFMLILGMVIHIQQEGIKFDKRFAVYLIALITTQSTMGYVAGLMIFGLLVIKQKKRVLSTFFIIASIFIVPNILKLEFVMPEIEQHIESGEKMEMGRTKETKEGGGILRINRYAAMILAIEEGIKWPFGYGIIQSRYIIGRYGEMIHGVGTLQYTLIRWGWLGLGFLIISLNKSIQRMSWSGKTDPLVRYILLLAILMGLFSNPLGWSPIFFAMVFYPYVYNNTNYSLIQENKLNPSVSRSNY